MSLWYSEYGNREYGMEKAVLFLNNMAELSSQGEYHDKPCNT